MGGNTSKTVGVGPARRRLHGLMRDLTRDGAFPGLSVACGVRGAEVFRSWTGDACRYGGALRRIEEDTRYDAASLTKVMVTLPAVLLLHDSGLVDLDAAVGPWLPEADASLQRVTVRHLLTHTSGLPAHREYWRNGSHDAASVLGAVLREQPTAPPGSAYLYSDLGFILLGEIVRRATGAELPDVFDSRIRAPLGLRATSYLPTGAGIAATEVVDGVALCGVVHDENARALGGVAGQAGLFTDLTDAAAYAAAWSRSAVLGLSPALVREAVTPQQLPTPTGRRGLAWVCAGDQDWDQVGPTWPRTTISHTGFTGVSLAADPDRGWWAAILGNAVHGGRDRPGLRRARLALHAAVADLLASVSADAGEPVPDLPTR